MEAADTETGIGGLELGFDEFVAIEIYKRDLALRDLIAEIRFVNEQIHVAMMAGAVVNGNQSLHPTGGRLQRQRQYVGNRC